MMGEKVSKGNKVRRGEVERLLAAALVEGVYRNVTDAVKAIAEETGRTERAVWKYVERAREINERGAEREVEKKEEERKFEEIKKKGEGYEINGISIFQAGMMERTIQMIGELVKDIEGRIRLNAQDRLSLSVAAEAYDRYLHACEQLKEMGPYIDTGRLLVANPANKLAKDNLTICFDILKRYGCSPYDRQRIEVLKEGGAEEDDLVKFIKKQNER